MLILLFNSSRYWRVLLFPPPTFGRVFYFLEGPDRITILQALFPLYVSQKYRTMLLKWLLFLQPRSWRVCCFPDNVLNGLFPPSKYWMGYNFLHQHTEWFIYSSSNVLNCLLLPPPTYWIVRYFLHQHTQRFTASPTKVPKSLLLPPPTYWMFYCFLHKNIEFFITSSTSTLNILIFPSPKYWIIYYLSPKVLNG